MRRNQPRGRNRRGAVVALLALAMLPILAILALAIDLGMFTLVRSQMQAAADSAALAGVRKLDGDYLAGHNGNYGNVQAAANAAAEENRVLSKQPFSTPATVPVPGAMATSIGHYKYNSGTSAFTPLYPGGASPAVNPDSGVPYVWSLVKAELNYNVPSAIAAGLWNHGGVPISTKAVAVHRPRDVALILDLSGSMGFDSTLGVDWSGTRYRTNSPDRAFPRFGHYGYAAAPATGSNVHDYAMFHNAAVNAGIDRDYNAGNLTVNPSSVNSSFLDAPPIVENFVTQSGGSYNPAWPASDFPGVTSDSYLPGTLVLPLGAGASTNDFQDQPGGDRPFLKATSTGLNLGNAYARTTRELTKGASNTTRDSLATRTFGADFEIRGYGLLPRTDGYPRFAGNLSASFRTNLTAPDNGFAGYTQGPRYWGKTFWQWPADPRQPVTASPRLIWNTGTSRWTRPTNLGLLNNWLAELDRNWMLLPNGRRANVAVGSSANNGIAGLSRYAAGAYDPLLAKWPVLADGSANPNAWSRLQTERFLRGLDPYTGTDLRGTAAQFAAPQNRVGADADLPPLASTYSVASVAQYGFPPTPPGGVTWHYGATAAFWNGPVVNPATGSAATAALLDTWKFPRCRWEKAAGNWSTNPVDGNLLLENLGYQQAKERALVAGSYQDVNSPWVAPSPALLTPFQTIPAEGVEWPTAPTQAELDAQIARLILALYDNAKADYDWRKRFFTANANAANWPDNTVLFQNRTVAGVSSRTSDLTGHFQRVPEAADSGANYSINYAAVLHWIKNVGPNPFPPNLRSGRVVYYNAIPSAIALPVPTDPDQLFWKEYIDWSLGFARATNTASGFQDTQTYSGFGRDFAWPNAAVTSDMATRPAAGNFQGGAVRHSDNTQLALQTWPGKRPFQNYADSPIRPKTRTWFGPMTMIDFLINNNLGIPIPNRGALGISGAVFQSQAAACKQGVRAALLDSKQNHPNDHMALIFFSANNGGSGGLASKRFHTARQAMGTSYQKMIDYLYFPPSTVRGERAEINWTDQEMVDVPTAYGGTCYDFPLLLAFNQFSANSSMQNVNSPAPLGNGGGLGRRGAQKIVIFETDGMPNQKCAVPTVQGSGDSAYFNVNASTDVTINGAAATACNFGSIVEQMVKPTSQHGFSYPGKPALVHAIGYGFLFEPTYTRSDTAIALAALGSMQSKGNVNDAADGLALFSHPTAGASTIASSKIITGDFSERVEKMRQAFTRILQEKTVQVSLIE